jgi:PPOX class probable F420-dependent enzyme
MNVTLPDGAKALVDDKNFATLASVMPSGQPQLSLVWVERDGDDLLISTVEGRMKHKNFVRDPRATVLIYPPDDPYTYLEVRGRVRMTHQGGRELIDDLNEKYHGTRPYPHDAPENVRVVIRLTPEKVVWRG